MAEKKTGDKSSAKAEKANKPVEKKTTKKTIKSAEKKNDEAAKAKAEPTVDREEEPERKEKKSHKVVWAVVITSVAWLTLFVLSFFLWLPSFALKFIVDNGWDDIEFWTRRRGDYSDVEDDIEDIYPNWKHLREWLDEKTDKEDKTETDDTATHGELIDNPNARVTIKNARLIEVEDLEFYLPTGFKPASANGRSTKYIYDLEDADGWADVKVYVEETTKDLGNYMTSKDSLLELTDSTYYMNGTSWMEMESGSSLAYGTRLGDKVYMVILNIKLESDDTAEAASMIPKTLRMKKIYK